MSNCSVTDAESYYYNPPPFVGVTFFSAGWDRISFLIAACSIAYFMVLSPTSFTLFTTPEGALVRFLALPLVGEVPPPLVPPNLKE